MFSCVHFFPDMPGSIALNVGISPSSGNLPSAELLAPNHESQLPNVVSETISLAKELFGGSQTPTESSVWNFIILKAIHKESRNGLNAEIRTNLLSKYEAKENLPH